MFELYYTELATGLRRGEWLALKWEDLDFAGSSIYVHIQVTRMNGKVQESPLKTPNAYRSIIVSEDVMKLLKEKKERENGFSKYVFSSPSGGPISPDSVLNVLHRVLKRAGLEKVRFHDLRHTFVTLARVKKAWNGSHWHSANAQRFHDFFPFPIKPTLLGLDGSPLLGFTLDTYGHITNAMKRDAAHKVGSFLSGAV